MNQSMITENQPAFEFPNPEEQADVLMEICEVDVQDAQTIATHNVKFARNERNRDYWSRVKGLISKEHD